MFHVKHLWLFFVGEGGSLPYFSIDYIYIFTGRATHPLLFSDFSEFFYFSYVISLRFPL